VLAFALAVVLAGGGMTMALAEPSVRFLVPVLQRMGFEGNRAYEVNNLLRKAGHVPAYGLLGFFVTRALRRRARHAGWSLVVVGVVGGIDELLQGTTPWRHASWADLGLDLVGGAAGLGLALWWDARRAQRSRERQVVGR
jgi:VanZ family protein